MKKILKVLAIIISILTPLMVQSNDLDKKICSLEFPINCIKKDKN